MVMAGFNPLYGPGISTSTFPPSSLFEISESKRLEFRSEFFNAFNKAHFGLPLSGVPSATAGESTSAGPARQIQMALKFFF